MTPTSTLTAGIAGSNDDIGSATDIGIFPYSTAQDTTKATVASDDPNMGSDTGVNSYTVWFRFVAASSGGVYASTSGSDYDTVMAAYSGSRGSLTRVASNDDDGTSGTYQSAVAFNVQAGTTYYLEVAAYGGGPAGQMRLSVQPGSAVSATSTSTVEPTWTPWPTHTPWPTSTPTATPGSAPSNDDINSALMVSSLHYSITVDTAGATVASDDPDMGSDTGVNSNTVWFRFVAHSSGSVQASTIGSSYDTVLAAFTGSRGALTLVTSNDDANGTSQSQVGFAAVAGTTYYLEAAQYGSSGGGQLQFRMDSTSIPSVTPTITPTGTMVVATPGTSRIQPGEVRTASVIADARYFSQTGYRVNVDAFWDFFNKRGGVRTFGYPSSQEFRLLGFQVQIFQRAVMQLKPDGSVTAMNLLDEGVMPYTKINGSTYPSPEKELIDAAPSPSDLDYGEQAIAFVRANVPDEWDGQPVRFLQSFLGTVRYEDAFPDGGGSSALVPLLDLETWGLPTSKPAYDPANHNFIYQRFQRGILHYDATTGVTQGLLLADYLKGLIIGQNVPADLEYEASGSRFYRQYDATKPNRVSRPAQLPGTDLTGAFEALSTRQIQTPSSTTTPSRVPTQMPAVGSGDQADTTHASCSFSLSPTSASYVASGGTGSVIVTTQANCSWTATSEVDWITVTGGSSGLGSGTVTYSVAPGSTAAARIASIKVADMNGQGDPVLFQISESTSTSLTMRGTYTFMMQVDPGGACGWPVTTFYWPVSIRVSSYVQGTTSGSIVFPPTAASPSNTWSISAGPTRTQVAPRQGSPGPAGGAYDVVVDGGRWEAGSLTRARDGRGEITSGTASGARQILILRGSDKQWECRSDAKWSLLTRWVDTD